MIGHHLGGAFQGTAYGGRYPGEGLHLSMGSLLEEQQQQQAHMGTMVSIVNNFDTVDFSFVSRALCSF